MITIYIDTHFRELVLGLYQNGKLIEKKTIESNLHSKNTVPLLVQILEENSLEVRDIKEVIVITGPGSFTGVRIGIVIAKMLGYCLSIPVKQVTYLEAMSVCYGAGNFCIKDRNGAFIGEFNEKNELIKPYTYLSNQELEEYPNELIENVELDWNKIYDYLKTKPAIDPHSLTPLYVKKIEAEK